METLVDEYVDSMTDEVQGFTNSYVHGSFLYSKLQLEQQKPFRLKFYARNYPTVARYRWF